MSNPLLIAAVAALTIGFPFTVMALAALIGWLGGAQ